MFVPQIFIRLSSFRTDKVLTVYVYPNDSRSSQLVIPYIFVILLAFLSEVLIKNMVSKQYPISEEIVHFGLIAQISIYYGDDETLEYICNIVRNLFT